MRRPKHKVRKAAQVFPHTWQGAAPSEGFLAAQETFAELESLSMGPSIYILNMFSRKFLYTLNNLNNHKYRKTEEQLNQGSANLFCKGPDSKHFTPCRPHNLVISSTSVSFRAQGKLRTQGPLFKIVHTFKMAAASTKPSPGPFSAWDPVPLHKLHAREARRALSVTTIHSASMELCHTNAGAAIGGK